MSREFVRYMSFLDGMLITREDSSTSTEYYAYTHPSGGWLIMRIQNAGTDTPSYDYYVNSQAKGGNFENDWTNRNSHNYKIYLNFPRKI